MSGYRPVERALVVGAGAIGLSWAAHFALHGVAVDLTDPDRGTRRRAPGQVHDLVAEVDPGRADAGISLTVEASPEDAAARADLVVECAPERLAVKRAVFATLDAHAPADVLLTSSSSGLGPGSFQDACARYPSRVLVAHPFNPPHLVPLVELVGGPATSPEAVAAADDVFTRLGKRVIHVRAELPGHVVNRLQAALWREAYDLVGRGVVSVEDVDTAIACGPGLRWALLGPFATQHLSGGGQGIAHVLHHLGPPMEQWWADLGTPTLDEPLRTAVVEGVRATFDGVDEADLRRRRDSALRAVLQVKADRGLR